MGRTGSFDARRKAVTAAVVTLGLGVGLAGARIVTSGGPSGRGAAAPSVKQFTFTTRPADVAGDPLPAPPPGAEPEDAAAAVAALLRSEQQRQPERAWPLLDAAGRARYPTAAAWARARSGRPAPVGFEILGVEPGPEGAVDVRSSVTHVPALDPFGGIVTARSQVIWRARNEEGRWRVAAEPESTVLDLPADAGAPDAVREWVRALGACDQARARALQAVEPLYGPADLASAPCRLGGEWAVGPVAGLETSADTAALQAAFGADVAAWARVVPLRGPSGMSFLAALAPMGEQWRVVGVTATPAVPAQSTPPQERKERG